MAELCFNTFNRSAYVVAEPDLPTQIAAAAAAGFPWFGPDSFSLRHWEASGRDLAELRDMVLENGMQIWEIAAMAIGEERESVALASDVARQAAVLKPRWVLCNIHAPVDESLCRLFDKVCSILEADGAGVRPAIEYLPWSPANSIATTMPLIDHVGTDRARILYDVWHHERGPDSDADLDAAAPDTIAYIQFDDALPLETADLRLETLERRTFPGEGEFDLAGYCDRMLAKGFDGVVSVEILNAEWRHRDQYEFARRAAETTRRFWP